MAKGKRTSRRDLRLEARWRSLLARHPKSGLSVRAFCAREQVKECGFYTWRRTLRRRDQEQAKALSFVPVVQSRREESGGDDPPPPMTIELRGGRVLRLPIRMPVVQVAELLRAIEGTGGTA
jgi:hypothetical protein